MMKFVGCLLVWVMALMPVVGEDPLEGVWEIDRSDRKSLEKQLMPVFKALAEKRGIGDEHLEEFKGMFMEQLLDQRMLFKRKEEGLWNFVFSTTLRETRTDLRVRVDGKKYFFREAGDGDKVDFMVTLKEGGGLEIHNTRSNTVLPFKKMDQKVLEAEKQLIWMEGEWKLDLADKAQIDSVLEERTKVAFEGVDMEDAEVQQFKEMLLGLLERQKYQLVRRLNGGWLFVFDMGNGEDPSTLVLKMQQKGERYHGIQYRGEEVVFSKGKNGRLMLHDNKVTKPLPLVKAEKE